MAADFADSKKLLLVDDEPDLLLITKQGLESAGFEVDAFDEPQVALRNFKPGHYVRIITDIRMPGMSGFELARRIWAMDSHTEICFLSSFEIHENEARRVLPSMKTYCFVKKPVAPAMLVRHVKLHAVKN